MDDIALMFQPDIVCIVPRVIMLKSWNFANLIAWLKLLAQNAS